MSTKSAWETRATKTSGNTHGQHGYTIVSKDSDFHERSLVKGFPPKIVWITRGNFSTEQIAGLLRANTVRISELHADPEAGYLMLR